VTMTRAVIQYNSPGRFDLFDSSNRPKTMGNGESSVEASNASSAPIDTVKEPIKFTPSPAKVTVRALQLSQMGILDPETDSPQFAWRVMSIFPTSPLAIYVFPHIDFVVTFNGESTSVYRDWQTIQEFVTRQLQGQTEVRMVVYNILMQKYRGELRFAESKFLMSFFLQKFKCHFLRIQNMMA
jgi:hypothetical protein